MSNPISYNKNKVFNEMESQVVEITISFSGGQSPVAIANTKEKPVNGESLSCIVKFRNGDRKNGVVRQGYVFAENDDIHITGPFYGGMIHVLNDSGQGGHYQLEQ